MKEEIIVAHTYTNIQLNREEHIVPSYRAAFRLLSQKTRKETQ